MLFINNSSRGLRRLVFPVVGFVAVAIFLGGCDLGRNFSKIDRPGDMEVQDYRDGLASRLPEEVAVADDGTGIPSFQPYVQSPDENLKPMPLVSISVNQTVPLRDVLFELAEQVGYDIELDPRISGSVIFTARNRPFDDVIKRIAEIAGLRYNFENDIMRVELDLPYNKTYKIDYLSYVRTSSGSVRNDVSVVSGSEASTGSSFEATSASEADFWGELETNLLQILESSPSSGNMRTGADPVIMAADRNPAPVDPIIVEGADGEQQVQVQPPNAVLQVSSLPTASGAAGGTNGEIDIPASSFALNKQAGMVSIFASERQQKQVREYLNLLRRSVTSQVLIEAKVMEVQLSDEFAAGVDWGQMGKLVNGNIDIALGDFAIPTFDNPASGSFSLTYASNDVNAVLEAVSRFGTVKALSSPRVTVLNNQSAVLNMANNVVYFETSIDITVDEGVTKTDIESEIKNVPEGVLISVQPSIDLVSGSISMAVRPTITRITDRIPDPAVAFVTQFNGINDVASLIPQLNVQEIDSVVRMNSGQAILMGGLMQDRVDSTQEGVPILSEIPLFGSVFRNQADSVSKTELVIFLKATILENDVGTDEIDRDLYKKFSGDRRPWKL